MRPEKRHNLTAALFHLAVLVLIGLFAGAIRGLDVAAGWGSAPQTNFFLGALLLAAYGVGQLAKAVRLPLLSGYILAGILAGPHVFGFLSTSMVGRLRLLDDLALSFIALAAGGHFDLSALAGRKRAILLNIVLLTLVVFGMISGFVTLFGNRFSFTGALSPIQMTALAMLLGVVAVARSPSSAIAIISECRAKGRFTDTVLGVTVAMDVLIIILFTLAMTIVRIMLSPGSRMELTVFAALTGEIAVSIGLGLLAGKLIDGYIRKAGYDLPFFLLFFAFGVAKASQWLSHFTAGHFGESLHLEPLIICMSAGFSVRNLGMGGAIFVESLERVSLPVFVLFFSLAGASLDLGALVLTWPLALCLAVVRASAIGLATWTGGTLSGDPARHNRTAWMAYLTQAGVAIGLAQLAMREFPAIGTYLTTVVLAVIALNQVVGPITFKMALNRVGEAGRR